VRKCWSQIDCKKERNISIILSIKKNHLTFTGYFMNENNWVDNSFQCVFGQKM